MRRPALASAVTLTAIVSLHCGGREGTLRTASAPPSTSSNVGGGAPSSDPLCGEGWKWDGTRCTQLDATVTADSKDAHGGSGGSRPREPGSSRGSNAGQGGNGGNGGGDNGGGSAGNDGAGGGGGPEVPSRATSTQAGGSAAGGSVAGTAQLVVRDVTVGTGAEAKSGDNVRIHYVGTLAADGNEFDSSRKRGIPFEFRLGSGQVIKGFDRGVIGMKVGGLRQVTIPPELGYGRKGAPPLIPPRATLIFEIELLDVT